MARSGLVLQDNVIGTTDMKANDGANRKHDKTHDLIKFEGGRVRWVVGLPLSPVVAFSQISRT